MLLAGGRSLRFGTDKAFALLKGRPFYQRLLNVLEKSCGEVLISANVPEKYAQTSHRVIPDFQRGKGPLGGLETVFEESRAPWLLILSCDMPLICAAAEKLLRENREPQTRLICFQDADRIHPFPGLYRRDLFPVLKLWVEGKSLRVVEFIESLPPNRKKLLNLDDSGKNIRREFVNVNTPDDLHILAARGS